MLCRVTIPVSHCGTVTTWLLSVIVTVMASICSCKAISLTVGHDTHLKTSVRFHSRPQLNGVRQQFT